MTHDELFHMMATVLKPFGQQHNEIWKKAFRMYNATRDRRLSMECTSCYMKVLNYHEEEAKKKNNH